MARRWVKLWVSESLRGTIRFDFTPAERSVWYDLLVLAGDCRQDGLIAPGSGVPYPLKWIAGTLNISSTLLKKTLEICKSSERIEINGDGIKILNWHKYQSEYERQKPFRYKKVTDKVTSRVTKRLPVEEEVEEDIKEIYKEKVHKKTYADNILLTHDEYQKLVERFGEQGAKDWIDKLSLGKQAKGYKYKSDYAAILTWERRDAKPQEPEKEPVWNVRNSLS